MHTCLCVRLCQHSFVLALFHEELVPVHPSGVCISLHFAMFIPVAVPVHALNLCW